MKLLGFILIINNLKYLIQQIFTQEIISSFYTLGWKPSLWLEAKPSLQPTQQQFLCGVRQQKTTNAWKASKDSISIQHEYLQKDLYTQHSRKTENSLANLLCVQICKENRNTANSIFNVSSSQQKSSSFSYGCSHILTSYLSMKTLIISTMTVNQLVSVTPRKMMHLLCILVHMRCKSGWIIGSSYSSISPEYCDVHLHKQN